MHRFLLAIAVFVYGLTSLGWVLDIHYCMGKVDAVHLFEKEKSSCGTCGMSAEESEGCCHDEAALVMLIQDQKPPVTLKFNLESPVFYLIPVVALLNKPDFLQRSTFVQLESAPPGFNNPLFLRYRVFRI
jgi:hypothetical protein